MKTLDREYLASHPEGDEKATVTLSAKVPQSVDVPLNTDGTRPEVTVVATSGTYLSLLQSLATLHEDINPVLEALTIELLTAEEAGRYSSLEEAAPLLRERFAEIVVPFRTHTVAFEIGGDGGGTWSWQSPPQAPASGPRLCRP